MSLVNNKKSLIIATSAGAVALLLGLILIGNQKPIQPVETPKYKYVVAKTNIKKGQEISSDNIEIKEAPVTLEGSYSVTTEIVGRAAKEDIMAGSPVLQSFVGALIPKKVQEVKKIEPRVNYRAFPVLIKKSAIPSFITTEDRFDLITRENTMKIENLKILDILPVVKNDNNKILLIEIANSDVSSFVKYYVTTKGFLFLQKNPEEFGEYIFHDLKQEKLDREKREEKEALEAMAKLMEKEPNLPPVDRSNLPDIGDIKLPVPEEAPKPVKQVEVVIGNVKSKVEFKDYDE